MKSTRSNCGFSLVELIVVVAIMAVLMVYLSQLLSNRQASQSVPWIQIPHMRLLHPLTEYYPLTQTSTILIREIPHPTTLSYGTPAQQPMM